MSRSILLNDENIKKYDIYVTTEGNYRSKEKKRTYYKHTCVCGNVFLGLKEQVFCSPSCSTSSPETQKKYTDTIKKTYGVEYNFQREDVSKKLEKQIDKSAKELFEYTHDFDFPLKNS